MDFAVQRVEKIQIVSKDFAVDKRFANLMSRFLKGGLKVASAQIFPQTLQ